MTTRFLHFPFFMLHSFVLLLLATFPAFSQYEIGISMKTRNDTAYLTHIFVKEENIRLDTAIVMKNGKGVFRGNKTLPKGMYYIVNDKRKMFQILIGNNQKFGIEVDTTDILKTIRFTSSPDNDAFYVHLRDNVQRGKKQQELIEQYQKAGDDAEKRAISGQLQTLYKEKMALTQKLISENEGLYVSKVLKAVIPLELPAPPRDDQGRITDSTFQYRWYRTHFFDYFNIYDPDMLRNNMYENKLSEYLKWFSTNHPVDTTCAELDRMLTKAKDNKELLRGMLAIMYNHFVNSNLMIRDNFWVHLVDNWYVPYADWATNIDAMKKNADKVRPTLIGKLAPPLDQLMVLPPGHFRAAALDTAIKNDIYAGSIIPDFRKSIRSKYLALIFWDVSCSHCKKAIQELWDVYEACKDKGLQVLAVQTLIGKEGKIKWIDFINEHGMYDWINAWIIYDLKWHELYIYDEGVPKVYLLNEKKEVMLRGNYDVKEIQRIVESDAAKN